MKIVVVNSNILHRRIEQECFELFDAVVINKKDDLSAEKLEEIRPDFIFFLHWSYIIPKSIYQNYVCVVFHMTDLPYGRGGSPLQNLIMRGHTETKISALKVEKGLDSGPVYLKRNLSLLGTAEDIFMRAGGIMLEMISEIVKNEAKPVEQSGRVLMFKRRTPEESNILTLNDNAKIYDFIRMLDADGYPRAFLETGLFKIEFSRAQHVEGCIVAEAKFIKK